MNQNEKKICYTLAEYLTLEYPSVIFRWDIAADIRLSIGQAMIVRKKLLHKRGYPDLFIAKPKGDYAGMFLEVKKDKGQVYKKDGNMRNSKHIREQAATLARLHNLGYYAIFSCGLDECIKEIDWYLGIVDYNKKEDKIMQTKPDNKIIRRFLENVMREGFNIAMGGEYDKSEEWNRRSQLIKYDKAIDRFVKEIKLIFRQTP